MGSERRLIDANPVIEKLRSANCSVCNHKTTIRCCVCWVGCVIERLEDAPTVDAVEVVHGHWTATDVIVHKAGYGVRYYYHAECKVNPHRLFECENDYCPVCGAKMDGGNDQ